MTTTQVTYRAYLLRLWRTPEAWWRASLEDPHTGEKRAFETLAQLLAFLDDDLARTARATSPAGEAGGPDPA